MYFNLELLSKTITENKKVPVSYYTKIQLKIPLMSKVFDF